VRATTRAIGALLLAFILAGAAVWLLTVDVYADTSPQYPGESAPRDAVAFCGSAYDVVLLGGDGFMGGEMPANQSVLDRQCVRRAGRDVAAGSVLAGAAMVVGAYAVGVLLVLRRGTFGASVLE
jgi:hypothetical protein